MLEWWARWDIELNYLLDLIGENPSEKRDFLLDLINKVYYDMF